MAQNNCTISLHFVGKSNHHKAYLLTDGKSDTALIDGTSAVFKMQISNALLAKVMLKDISHGGMFSNSEVKWIYAMPGIIDMNIIDEDSIFKAEVSGPELTTIYDQQLRMPVDRYNLQNYLLRVAYAKAKKEGRADTAELTQKRTESIKACFGVPQAFIKANPTSPLSIVALNFLGNGSKIAGLYLSDLEELFNSLTEEIRNSEEGQKYAEKLRKWKEKKEG